MPRRFLFVVPPLTGHINPLRAVAAELTDRGHRVAWAGHTDQLHSVLGPEAETYGCAMPADILRPPELAGPAAFKFLWEEFFGPLAELMAPGVEAAVDAYAPDVVVADQHALAGALVAERRGLVHLTSCSTSAELIDPLASMPKVAAWLHGLLAELRERLGDPTATHDPRWSPHGVLAFSTRELLGDIPLPAENIHLVGPAVDRRPRTQRAGDFPWDALDPTRHRVLVSLGTANTDNGRRFLTEALTALDTLRGTVQGIVVDPGDVLAGTPVPPGVLLRPYVPQLDLLPHLSAVVCHSGHNTVCESLWHGVPLVLAPIRDDQPLVAGLVTAAGAGLRVRFNRVDAPRLAKAIDTVLDPDSGHAAAARRLATALHTSGGPPAAATHLEATLPARRAD